MAIRALGRYANWRDEPAQRSLIDLANNETACSSGSFQRCGRDRLSGAIPSEGRSAGFTAQQERDIASTFQYTLKAEDGRVPAQSAVSVM